MYNPTVYTCTSKTIVTNKCQLKRITCTIISIAGEYVSAVEVPGGFAYIYFSFFKTRHSKYNFKRFKSCCRAAENKTANESMRQ